MSNDNEVRLSPLNDEESLISYLINNFLVSKSKIKKMIIPKKKLDMKILKRKEITLPINLLNDGIINPNYFGQKIKIIYEDDKTLIFDKPHNIFSHPLSYDESNNCLSFFRSSSDRTYHEMLSINNLNYDRGLLYRLDYETSGVMFYIKNDCLYEDLRNNFLNIAKEKKYIAIVNGFVSNSKKLEDYIKYIGKKGSRGVVIPNKENNSTLATLEYKPLKYDSTHDITLLEISLNTGARHQIRIQLSNMGHPILGDELYGGRKCTRLFLHAYKYKIIVDQKEHVGYSREADLFDTFFNLNSIF